MSILETTYKKLDGGGYEVLVDIDCVGGGSLSSDKCEGSATCVTATFKNAKDEALESVETCKDLVGVDITTFIMRSEKALKDAVTITVVLEVKNDELIVFESDKETTINIQK